jgi:group II intron reverse transcriptase/maturase
VDGVTLEEFEADLKDNLYRVWNRMSSGSYFPPPVRGVEIPKPHGQGVRMLGVPSVADRVAQTVVARVLEEKVEPVFHPDSYGYRSGRGALDAVAACRKRCWSTDWVIDLDIRAFFDTVPWDLVVKAVEANTDLPWVVLCVKRWLEAPLALPDGTLRQRDRGTPQGVCDLTCPGESVPSLCVRLVDGQGISWHQVRALCGRCCGALRQRSAGRACVDGTSGTDEEGRVGTAPR